MRTQTVVKRIKSKLPVLLLLNIDNVAVPIAAHYAAGSVAQTLIPVPVVGFAAGVSFMVYDKYLDKHVDKYAGAAVKGAAKGTVKVAKALKAAKGAAKGTVKVAKGTAKVTGKAAKGTVKAAVGMVFTQK